MVSVALRLAAVVVATTAVAVLLRGASAHRGGAPPPAVAEDVPEQAAAPEALEPDQVATAEEGAGSWSLRAGGWYIRVDGVPADLSAETPPAERSPVVHPVAARPRPDPAGISPFDGLIAQHAEAHGFDWRLVAALIFEESRFNPTSESGAGAYGLMQVRPIAAHTVGADRFWEPSDNISAGVRYLRYLDDLFRGAAERDRIGLVLAAYNMGPGHVQDAQRLARYVGLDPNRWQGHIERLLPLLELPAVYTRLPNGFARGHETVAYVQRTIDRYRLYQRQRPDTAAVGGRPPAVDGEPVNG
jgi:hypothetical protein